MKREDLSRGIFRHVIEQLEGLAPEEFERLTKAVASWPNNQFASKEEVRDSVEINRSQVAGCQLIKQGVS